MDKEGNDRIGPRQAGKPTNMTMYPSVHVSLPSDARAARAARRSLCALEDYVSGETIDDLTLLVSELVSNCVKHASLASNEGIQVDAEPAGKKIHVEVTNPGGAELTNKIGRRSEESGWGLFILTRVASRWGVTTDGSTSVWFEIDLGNDGLMISA